MKFPPDPLTLALGREVLRASDERRENVRRTFDSQSFRLPGAVAGDAFNKSLDLDVRDTPSKSTEGKSLPFGLQPLLSTKEGIHNTELVYRGSGMIANSASEGTGKINPWQEPLAMTKGPHTAEEIAEIRRVQMGRS
jgi:hypothetical protein